MELRYFVIRRLLLIIPTLIGVSIFAFVLIRSFPNYILAQDYISSNTATAGVPYQVLVQQASEKLGLTYPVPVQYFYFLQNMLTGQWGYVSSPVSGSTIEVIHYLLPNTLQLLIFTFILTMGIGLPVGTYMGSRPRSAADHVGNVFSLIGFAMPQFFFGLILLLVFGLGVGKWFGAVFPVYGVVSFRNVPPSWAFNHTTGFYQS